MIDLTAVAGRRTALGLVLTGCVLMLARGAARAAPAAGAAGGGRLALPSDPDAVVLRYQSLGGMAGTSGPPHPVLVLHADGRFSARPNTPNGRLREGRLPAVELGALLAEIVEQRRFATIDAAAIQSQMRAIERSSNRIFKVMDGGEVDIELRLPSLQHRVVFHGLSAAPQLFPEIAALQDLYAVQQHLLRIASTAQ